MTKEKYLEKRNQLLQDAQDLLNDGKVEDAAKKRAEIETLDADFEAAATEEANINALQNNSIPQAAQQFVNHITTEKSGDDKSAAYRIAFFKNLQGKDLTQEERLAFTSGSSSAGAAIPTETAEKIITKLKERAPLLNEITLLQVAGNVSYVVEGTTNEASKHTENATISESNDSVISVKLGGYEVTKLIRVSDTVKTMSINAFENWLVDMLVFAVADKISAYLINGTGSSEPQGVEKANTWGDDNSVTITKTGSLTANDILKLIGLLAGGYDPNAKFLMSKKTLFTDVMPLKDNAKNDLVTREGKNYFIYGYPVLIDSRVTEHEAYFGDFTFLIGNLAETVNVKSGFDLDTNSNKYLGVAIFDCKVALGEAFVKLIKATA